MHSHKRIVLVTGANKGIGLETARQLAQAGHTVLLGARDHHKGAAAAAKLAAEGLHVEAITIDVDDAASIARAVAHVSERHGKLDSLINNAGVLLEPLGSATLGSSLDVWRKTFETNLFSLIAVTLAFLPLIRKSDAGRIVNLSSILASLTLHSDPNSPIYNFKTGAYDSSKTAVNAFTVHLAHELRDTPIKVNSAHPGWVKTELGGDGAPMELEDGAKTSVALATLPADGPTGAFIHLGAPLPW